MLALTMVKLFTDEKYAMLSSENFLLSPNKAVVDRGHSFSPIPSLLPTTF